MASGNARMIADLLGHGASVYKDKKDKDKEKEKEEKEKMAGSKTEQAAASTRKALKYKGKKKKASLFDAFSKFRKDRHKITGGVQNQHT